MRDKKVKYLVEVLTEIDQLEDFSIRNRLRMDVKLPPDKYKLAFYTAVHGKYEVFVKLSSSQISFLTIKTIKFLKLSEVIYKIVKQNCPSIWSIIQFRIRKYFFHPIMVNKLLLINIDYYSDLLDVLNRGVAKFALLSWGTFAKYFHIRYKLKPVLKVLKFNRLSDTTYPGEEKPGKNHRVHIIFRTKLKGHNMLLFSSFDDGRFNLLGGSIGDGETWFDALKREVKEESAGLLEFNDRKDYFFYHSFDKYRVYIVQNIDFDPLLNKKYQSRISHKDKSYSSLKNFSEVENYGFFWLSIKQIRDMDASYFSPSTAKIVHDYLHKRRMVWCDYHRISG